jgi:hypothetical protein
LSFGRDSDHLVEKSFFYNSAAQILIPMPCHHSWPQPSQEKIFVDLLLLSVTLRNWLIDKRRHPHMPRIALHSPHVAQPASVAMILCQK